jgi:hypothetical protein
MRESIQDSFGHVPVEPEIIDDHFYFFTSLASIFDVGFLDT